MKNTSGRKTRPIRRGSLLIQVMMYVTIGSTLMILGGVCLQTTFRADTLDRRESLSISSLQRVDRAIRHDAADRGCRFVSGNELAVQTSDGATIQWFAERGMLVRTESRDGVTQRREKFIFPAGTQIAMRAEAGRVVLRVQDPPPFVSYPTSASGGEVSRKSVEERQPLKHVRAPFAAEIVLLEENP